MYDFVSHILRRYFEATGWNEYNSYLNLTASSSAVLDFAVPTGLSLSVSACPTPPFFTSYRLGALPNLHARIGYIYAATETPLNLGSSSKDVRFKAILERFRIVESPRPPEPKSHVWLAGQRVDSRDYLIYGSMHVPSARLDALYTTRLSDNWQLVMTAVSTPPKYPLTALQNAASSRLSSNIDSSTGATNGSTSTSTTAAPVSGAGNPGSTNLQLTLQNDTGKWFTEYSYSVDDALWGFRVLHNFGTGGDAPYVNDARPMTGEARTDNDSDAGGGLRGQFSAGAEVFVSTVERSAGLSTGVRFSTLPDTSDQPSQPPTVITANLNPMMGHLSTAYAARMARDVVVCSRYDFNVYSYDSEWTVGAEYWLRAVQPNTPRRPPESISEVQTSTPTERSRILNQRNIVAPIRSQLSLRDDASDSVDIAEQQALPAGLPLLLATNPISGCLKARISTASDIRLLWQSRLQHCLLSLGVKADLAATAGIVKSIGIEIMYSSNSSAST